MFKKIIRHAVIGLLIGSLTFLFLILITGKSVYVTPIKVFNVLLLSLLIGILSMIFDSERFNFTLALGIHYIGVLLLVVLMNVFNDWGGVVHTWNLILVTTMIYIVIWLCLHWMSVINVRKINERILKNRRDNQG